MAENDIFELGEERQGPDNSTSGHRQGPQCLRCRKSFSRSLTMILPSLIIGLVMGATATYLLVPHNQTEVIHTPPEKVNERGPKCLEWPDLKISKNVSIKETMKILDCMKCRPHLTTFPVKEIIQRIDPNDKVLDGSWTTTPSVLPVWQCHSNQSYCTKNRGRVPRCCVLKSSDITFEVILSHVDTQTIETRYIPVESHDDCTCEKNVCDIHGEENNIVNISNVTM